MNQEENANVDSTKDSNNSHHFDPTARVKATPELAKSFTSSGNPELDKLGTHMAGAVDLHETRTTGNAVQINPPIAANPGAIDSREERFLGKRLSDN